MSKDKQKLSKGQRKKIAKQAAQLNISSVETLPAVQIENKIYERLTPPRTINRQYKKIRLECVSPVHIGSGETLKAVEYLYNSDQQTVYFLDESKWIKFLAEKNFD